MRILEKRLSKRIAAAVLVGSPFSSVIRVEAMMDFFTKPVDWPTVRGAAREFIVIHAKDDPLVPYDHALRYQEALDATLLLKSKGGHFTSKKAPPLLRIADAFLK
jgi:predicted alpha/beta hydrolase family esterase